jgi:hypothetical protein
MAGDFGSLIPKRWAVQPNPLYYYQFVFINWLEVQVPTKVPAAQLEELRGWRNREVYSFIKDMDWTIGMFDKPLLHEYQQPSESFLRLHGLCYSRKTD